MGLAYLRDSILIGYPHDTVNCDLTFLSSVGVDTGFTPNNAENIQTCVLSLHNLWKNLTSQKFLRACRLD